MTYPAIYTQVHIHLRVHEEHYINMIFFEHMTYISGEHSREMLQNWSASFFKRNALLGDGQKKWLLYWLLCNNTTKWQPAEHTHVKKVFQTLSGDKQTQMFYHDTVKQVSRIPTCFSVKSSLMLNKWSGSLYKWSRRRPVLETRALIGQRYLAVRSAEASPQSFVIPDAFEMCCA